MCFGKNCIDHVVTKLQYETNTESITANANCAAQLEAYESQKRLEQSSVYHCVAFPSVKNSL